MGEGRPTGSGDGMMSGGMRCADMGRRNMCKSMEECRWNQKRRVCQPFKEDPITRRLDVTEEPDATFEPTVEPTVMPGTMHYVDWNFMTSPELPAITELV